MAAIKIRRKAATPKGFLRRLKDARFEDVEDPRDSSRIEHELEAVLKLGVLALTTGARSTRAVEERSVQLREPVRSRIGLKGRISDNGFALLLRRISPTLLRKSVQRQVKAEWTRKNLKPVRLPWSTVAIDGKHLATIPEKRLRGWVDAATPLDGFSLKAEELRRVLSTVFPDVQLQDGSGGCVGLVRAHRATLISSDAAVVLDQHPVRGKTNEYVTILDTLRALFSAYGRTKMVEMVTFDAGNTRPEAADYIRGKGAHYFLALRSGQGAIHQMALDELDDLPGSQAIYRTGENYNGQMVCYTVWQHELAEGHPDWAHARQLFRIERVAADDEGVCSVGNRYFVTSVANDELDAEQAVELARAHWRCENEGHWTADAIWDEDARRTPWTTHPHGILNVGLLRAMAINMLAMLRTLSRVEWADKLIKPSWKTVVEQALLVLCEPLLSMEAFNACDG